MGKEEGQGGEGRGETSSVVVWSALSQGWH